MVVLFAPRRQPPAGLHAYHPANVVFRFMLPMVTPAPQLVLQCQQHADNNWNLYTTCRRLKFQTKVLLPSTCNIMRLTIRENGEEYGSMLK